MALFYAPEIKKSSVLNEIESAHCIKVLRKKVGDDVELFDGLGNFYDAKIVVANSKHCEVEVLKESKDNQGPFMSYIAVAPTKNFDRIATFIEKSVEIGIGGFTFLKSEHSERKKYNIDKVNKVVIAAMKQSHKALKPYFGGFIDFESIVSQEFKGQKYICHVNEGSENVKLLNDLCKEKEKVLVLIGPEGDFSPREVALAKENGFKEASLGETILRTETAALVASLIVELKNQK